jgi:hypothetical protein
MHLADVTGGDRGIGLFERDPVIRWADAARTATTCVMI